MAPASSRPVLTRKVDPTSERAVYRQIADHLRAAIGAGDEDGGAARLAEGDRLPSEAQLMEHYGVTRMTIRHALDVLKGEGLVVTEAGRGAFVRDRPTVRRLGSDRFLRRDGDGGEAADRAEIEAEGAGGDPAIDHVIVTEEQPEPDVAERLKLRAKTKVVVRRRRYLVEGRPVEMATSYVPAPIARRTPIARPDSGPGGIYARLEELGHKLDHVDEEVRARMPTPDEAEALQLPTGVPVLHLVRTAYDTNGRPVEVCDTVMSADAFVLDYQLPAR